MNPLIVPPERVRQLQIIQAAMGLGVVIFAIVVFSMGSVLVGAPDEPDTEVIDILTVAHLATAISGYAAAAFLFNAQLSRWNGAPETFFDVFQTATIVRLALMEGAALFGLVVYLLAGQAGIENTSRTYFVNAASVVIFIGFVILTFPTPERIEAVYNEKAAR
ncbi:MAG: hypothetical protein IAF08_12790 [Rhizobacter sp.]|nr:hypothetical protein [Chlorobiales bacterium]